MAESSASTVREGFLGKKNLYGFLKHGKEWNRPRRRGERIFNRRGGLKMPIDEVKGAPCWTY